MSRYRPMAEFPPGYNALMEPSRPDDEDISDEPTQDRPMGKGTSLFKTEEVKAAAAVEEAKIESNETVDLARIAADERKHAKEMDAKTQTSLWGTVGKLVGGIIVVVGLFGLAYWATQGASTTIETEHGTVTVEGRE